MSWYAVTRNMTVPAVIQLPSDQGAMPSWLLITGDLGNGLLLVRGLPYAGFAPGAQVHHIKRPDHATTWHIISINSTGFIKLVDPAKLGTGAKMARFELFPAGMTNPNFSVYARL